ncbi:MAG: alkylhalidase [Planctomycetaceae bacterium]|nr:alkylhalidase [Planctomycetaceae bacterium]
MSCGTAPHSFSKTMNQLDSQYDVIVIGAGPAGTTAAALIAEYGHKTLILDRSPFPRFHVGESLIPETYWSLERLGLIEQLKQSAFPKKYSVQFVTEMGKESRPFYFDEYKAHESSQTWQVWRDDFDQMMLDNAVRQGATARTDAQVLDVNFDADVATDIKVRLGEGDSKTDQTIDCRVVVDATGQSAFLASRLGLKSTDPHLKKGTVWSYFENAHRDPDPRDEGATIILQTEGKQSWFWYIPLPGNVTSIGCTGDMNYMFQAGESAEQIFDRELSRCPGMIRRLEGATRCRDYFTTKDFSYRSSKAAGNGWVLIGDAFGFIDPVYSTGVFLALKSGEFAADAIHEAFETSDFSEGVLGSWQDKYVHGIDLFKKLVYAFYTPGFSFGSFLKEHPQYRSNLVDLLIGDVFKLNVGDIFTAMQDVLPME